MSGAEHRRRSTTRYESGGTLETVALDGRFGLSALVAEVGDASLWHGHVRPGGHPVSLLVFDAESVAGGAIRLMQAVESVTDADRDGELVVRGFADDDERLVVVMEPLVGQSLRSIVVREAPLPLSSAVAIVASIADALVAGHEAGESWGGVEPEAVILDGDAESGYGARILPSALWGAAVGEMDVDLLGLRGVCYRPPEVLLGEAWGPQADVFSLGVLLFELTTGEPPFEGHSARTLAARVISSPVRSVRSCLGADADADHDAIDAMIDRLMRKAASERPADARAALEVLLPSG